MSDSDDESCDEEAIPFAVPAKGKISFKELSERKNNMKNAKKAIKDKIYETEMCKFLNIIDSYLLDGSVKLPLVFVLGKEINPWCGENENSKYTLDIVRNHVYDVIEGANETNIVCEYLVRSCCFICPELRIEICFNDYAYSVRKSSCIERFINYIYL